MVKDAVSPSPETPGRKGFKGINSVLRALTIVEILAQRHDPMGVTELAHLLRLDPSTVYRLLATMMLAGWVHQDPQTRCYYLALKVAHLGGLVQEQNLLCDRALPILRSLAASSGETAHLATLDGSEVVFIAHEVSRNYLVVNVDLLSRGPSYCTAVGKAMLSCMSPTEVEMRLDGITWEPLTPKTITSIPELLRDLQKARELGYAIDDEEYSVGVRCVASAIQDSLGKPIAAVGLTGPTVRFTADRIQEFSTATRAAAQQIAESLGPGLYRLT